MSGGGRVGSGAGAEPAHAPVGDPASEMASAALDPEAAAQCERPLDGDAGFVADDGGAPSDAGPGAARGALAAGTNGQADGATTGAVPAYGSQNAAAHAGAGSSRALPGAAASAVAPSSKASTVPSPSLRNRHVAGLLFAAAGAILFSGKAIIVKLGFRYGADAITLLALRMLVAFPLFLLMAWWAARRAARPLDAGQRWRIAGLGVLGYYLASFLDFAGLAYISATLERLILYLTPTLVLLVGWLAFARRPSRMQWLALAVSYLGVGLAFGHDLQSGDRGILLGGALVFASAISYALYLVGSGELVGAIGSVRLTAYASSVASVLCIGQFLLLRPVSALVLPHEVYWLSLVNGTLCTVAPVLLVMLGISRLGSGLAAQVGMLGPVSTIVLSMLVLGEAMGPWQVAGTLLVLGGVLLVTRAPRPRTP